MAVGLEDDRADGIARCPSAYGPVKVLPDGSFTSSFDEPMGLLLECTWLLGLALTTGLVFGRLTRGASA